MQIKNITRIIIIIIYKQKTDIRTNINSYDNLSRGILIYVYLQSNLVIPLTLQTDNN